MGQVDTMTLSGEKLKKLAHANHTATVTAMALASRERIRNFSDIRRTKAELIRQGEKIVDSDYIQFWKDLEAQGVGSIIYGRRGVKPDKFAWHYSLKAVSKSMIEGEDITVKRFPDAPPLRGSSPEQSSKIQRTAQVGAPEPLTQKVTVVISTNRIIELRVPDNFTKAEAERVATAIRSVAQ